MYFYERKRKGEKLQNYREAAQELQYRASRTDDPNLKVMAKVGHAAEMRANGRELAGATRYDGKRWDPKRID